MKNKIYEKLYSEKKEVNLEKVKVQLESWKDLMQKSDLINMEFYEGLSEVRRSMDQLANGVKLMKDAQDGVDPLRDKMDEMIYTIQEVGLEVPTEFLDEFDLLTQIAEADVYTLNNNYEAIEQILSRLQGIN